MASPYTPYRRTRHQAAAATREANAVRRRGLWRELADKARVAGLDLSATDADFALTFGNLTARAEHGGEPPFEGASDRKCAEALRLLCRAWLDRPAEQREDVTDTLVAAGRLVDALLTASLDRAAQTWRRQFERE
jgi:hypothetical protein